MGITDFKGKQVLVTGAGHFAIPGLGAYSASKYAVKGFDEALRMELWNTPVGVTTVHPGVINTAIVRMDANSANARVTRAQTDQLQSYYQKNGVSPDVVAEAIIKGVMAGKQTVNTGPGAGLMYMINRISPSLARRISMASGKKMGYWV